MTQMNADEETGKVRLRAWRMSFAFEQSLHFAVLSCFLTLCVDLRHLRTRVSSD